jgi:hypothetical protein
VLAAGLGASSTVLVRRYDFGGAPLGDATDLGPAKLGRPVAVGASGEKAIVVWATPDDGIRSRIFAAGGASAPVASLEEGAAFGDLAVAIAPSNAKDGSSFTVVWSLYRVALDAYRVYAARVSDQGVVGLPQVVFGSALPIRVVGVVGHAGGMALLANRDGEPMVVPLDVLGRPTGPAHLFAGAREVGLGGGQGLAVNGAELAIVAAHRNGGPALRRLDLSGAPKEGWICLDSPRPDELHTAGITADGAGYAAVIAAPGGKASLLRVDATGRGPLP